MSLKSLIATGTKLWLDSIDPELVTKNRAAGVHRRDLQPIIVSDILKSGAYDTRSCSSPKRACPTTTSPGSLTDTLVRQRPRRSSFRFGNRPRETDEAG